jgi:hypothetical protein
VSSKQRRFGPTLIYNTIVRLLDEEPGTDYLSVERVMGEAGFTVRTAWTFWKAESKVVQKMLHNGGQDAVLVTQEVHAADAKKLDVDQAKLHLAGGGGVGGGVGLYFPNGNVNDPYHLAANLHRAISGGAAAGNMLHMTAQRLESGNGDGPGARIILNVFREMVLKENDPAANAVIRRRIPKIPQRLGGQYPLGITAASSPSEGA